METKLRSLSKAVEKIPEWELCYIVNDDPSGLSQKEISQVHDFYKSYEEAGLHIQFIVPADKKWESYFSHYPAFGLPGSVVDCDVLYYANDDVISKS